MQLQDKVRGEFGPDRAVAGADALLEFATSQRRTTALRTISE